MRSVRFRGKREIEKLLRDFKRSGLSAKAWSEVWRWIMRYNVAVCDAILPERLESEIHGYLFSRRHKRFEWYSQLRMKVTNHF